MLDTIGSFFINIGANAFGQPLVEAWTTLMTNEKCFRLTAATLKPKYEQQVAPSSYDHVAENLRIYKQDFVDFFREVDKQEQGLSEFLKERIYRRADGWIQNKPEKDLLYEIIEDFYKTYLGVFVTQDPHLASLYSFASTQETERSIKRLIKYLENNIDTTITSEIAKPSFGLDICAFLASLNISFEIIENDEQHIDLQIVNTLGLLPSNIYLFVFGNLNSIEQLDHARTRLPEKTRWAHVLVTSLNESSLNNHIQLASNREIEYVDWQRLRKLFLSMAGQQSFVVGKPAFELLMETHNVEQVYVNQDAVPAYPGERMDDKYLNIRVPVTQCLKDFLASETDSILFVLGGYGSGKTVFCIKTCFNYANGADGFVPIYIPLQRLKNTEDLGDVINKAVRVIQSLYSEKIKSLVVLDALDELPNAMSLTERRKNILNILRVSSMCTKLIITARTSYFSGLKDLWKLFLRPDDGELWSKVSKYISQTNIAPGVRVILMREFDSKQISDYLIQYGKKVGDSNYSKHFFSDLAKHNIEGEMRILARNPLYLFLIVRSEPWNRTTIGCYTDVLSILIDYWLQRDIEKGPSRWLLSTDDRKLFIQTIACWMHSAGTSYVTYSKLEKFARGYFGVNCNQEELDSIILDLQTTGVFLALGSKLYFGLTDFQDFFVSRMYIPGLDLKFKFSLPLPTPRQVNLIIGMVESSKICLSPFPREGSLVGRLNEAAIYNKLKIDDDGPISLSPNGILFGPYNKQSPWGFINSDPSGAHKCFRGICNSLLERTESDYKSIDIRVANRLGLHARAAAKVISGFSQLSPPAKDKEVWLTIGGQKADPRSIMAIMMLAVSTDQTVTLLYQGYSLENIEQTLLSIGMTPESGAPDKWVWNEDELRL